jgi:hypothetical protein
MQFPITRRMFLVSLVSALLLTAGPVRADDEGWTRLGRATFNASTKEKDVVASIMRGGWRYMKIKVEDANLQIDSVAIMYSSGKDADVKVTPKIKAGRETKPISLKDEDRMLRKIKIKGHSSEDGKDSHVEVWVKD